jgi:type IX secretion system substrate protein
MKEYSMKHLIAVMICLTSLSAGAQSVLTLGPGTSMGVLPGADMCSNIINGLGIMYGGGTVCGGSLVGIEPLIQPVLPESFDISQNYPNPFNPATTVKYQIPKAAYVSLKLYDALGRETAVLFEGEQPAGYYRVVIDGTNLASGLYFFKIISGDFSKVIKMNLIK